MTRSDVDISMEQGDRECPLCMEPFEIDDINFYPCTCEYQICRFCWHRIRTDENGLCPACRQAYPENPVNFKPLTTAEFQKVKTEKKLKEQQKKQKVSENRQHLANLRVVQKNLVFVVGLPGRLADQDILKRPEHFGKFGRIQKIMVNNQSTYVGSQGPSASAYITFFRADDALRAIQKVNNMTLNDGRTIKASLGTTKYCSNFLKNLPCNKPDCMYLHEVGDMYASFTKEDMQQGKHTEYEKKLVEQIIAQTLPNHRVSPSDTEWCDDALVQSSTTSVDCTSLNIELASSSNCVMISNPTVSVAAASQKPARQNNKRNKQKYDRQNKSRSPTLVRKTDGSNKLVDQNGKNKNSQNLRQGGKNNHNNSGHQINHYQHSLRGGIVEFPTKPVPLIPRLVGINNFPNRLKNSISAKTQHSQQDQKPQSTSPQQSQEHFSSSASSAGSSPPAFRHPSGSVSCPPAESATTDELEPGNAAEISVGDCKLQQSNTTTSGSSERCNSESFGHHGSDRSSSVDNFGPQRDSERTVKSSCASSSDAGGNQAVSYYETRSLENKNQLYTSGVSSLAPPNSSFQSVSFSSNSYGSCAASSAPVAGTSGSHAPQHNPDSASTNDYQSSAVMTSTLSVPQCMGRTAISPNKGSTLGCANSPAIESYCNELAEQNAFIQAVLRQMPADGRSVASSEALFGTTTANVSSDSQCSFNLHALDSTDASGQSQLHDHQAHMLHQQLQFAMQTHKGTGPSDLQVDAYRSSQHGEAEAEFDESGSIPSSNLHNGVDEGSDQLDGLLGGVESTSQTPVSVSSHQRQKQPSNSSDSDCIESQLFVGQLSPETLVQRLRYPNGLTAPGFHPPISRPANGLGLDWQAAFGFKPDTKCDSDDLGFDPYAESSKGLADLLNEEQKEPMRQLQYPYSLLQDGYPGGAFAHAQSNPAGGPAGYVPHGVRRGGGYSIHSASGNLLASGGNFLGLAQPDQLSQQYYHPYQNPGGDRPNAFQPPHQSVTSSSLLRQHSFAGNGSALHATGLLSSQQHKLGMQQQMLEYQNMQQQLTNRHGAVQLDGGDGGMLGGADSDPTSAQMFPHSHSLGSGLNSLGWRGGNGHGGLNHLGGLDDVREYAVLQRHGRNGNSGHELAVESGQMMPNSSCVLTSQASAPQQMEHAGGDYNKIKEVEESFRQMFPGVNISFGSRNSSNGIHPFPSSLLTSDPSSQSVIPNLVNSNHARSGGNGMPLSGAIPSSPPYSSSNSMAPSCSTNSSAADCSLPPPPLPSQTGVSIRPPPPGFMPHPQQMTKPPPFTPIGISGSPTSPSTHSFPPFTASKAGANHGSAGFRTPDGLWNQGPPSPSGLFKQGNGWSDNGSSKISSSPLPVSLTSLPPPGFS